MLLVQSELCYAFRRSGDGYGSILCLGSLLPDESFSRGGAQISDSWCAELIDFRIAYGAAGNPELAGAVCSRYWNTYFVI